jgi:hypothetical protein
MHFSELFLYQEEINLLANLIISNNSDYFSLSAILHDKVIVFQFLSVSV